MAYQLNEYSDPSAFYDAVMPHLLEREAECCAQIGLVTRMKSQGYTPVSADELDRPLLWTIVDGERIELVVIQTLKKSMIVTRGSTPVMIQLAEALAARNWNGSALTGVTPSIESLVERYATLSGRQKQLSVGLRVFQLERVAWPKSISGAMRHCEADDRNVVSQFIAGFEQDTGERSDEPPLVRADRLIGDRRIFLWIDSKPVAMAAFAGPTLNGIRVNWVYTPPEFRGQGYASNLVAHLTQRLLNEGRKYCFLFTDRANPTSNSIYQKIGYRAMADSERWEFDAAH